MWLSAGMKPKFLLAIYFKTSSDNPLSSEGVVDCLLIKVDVWVFLNLQWST